MHLSSESLFEPIESFFVPCLCLAESAIELFFQFIVELNAQYFAAPAFDLGGGFLVQAVKRGVVLGLLGLYQTGIDGLFYGHQAVLPNQVLSLLGDGQDLLRLLFEGTGPPSLDEPLLGELADIALEAGTVSGIGELGEIFQRDDAELGYCGESRNLGGSEPIDAVSVGVLASNASGESVGWARVPCPCSTYDFVPLGMGGQAVGFRFCGSQLFEQAGLASRASASSRTDRPA